MFGSLWLHLTGTRMLFQDITHKHLLMPDTWLHLAVSESHKLLGKRANKKGEMSAVRVYILTTKLESPPSSGGGGGGGGKKKPCGLSQHPPVWQTQETPVWIHICQQNKCNARAEMSQSWGIRKRKLAHIWRKSGGMTQSASEWDGEIPQAHCEHKGHANTFTEKSKKFLPH